MADTKITALTALTAADPANDVIPIVDVSDFTMAASGTTKKISINNILSSSPTATGAFSVTGLVTAGSATITGAATVGTTLGVTGVSTLTGNVGVGNAPSAWTLTAVQVGKGSIYGSGNETGYLGNAYYGSGGFKYIAAAGASFYQQNGGVHQWYTAAAGAAANDPVTTFTTAKMALSVAGDLSLASGNLIIGTSGKGIDFSAVTGGTGTATGNVLNDYEEGTFTPTVGASSGTGFTVTINSAIYTKIGRAVTVIFDFSIVAVGSATGAFQFSLPFNQSASSVSCGAFRENGTTGNMGQVFYNTAADVSCFLYNNVTVWNNGYRLRGTYTYSV